MAKQDRAVRTRAALIRAAAVEFARSGYAGTAVSSITRTAGVSVGALTFHFDSKSDLADAVLKEAHTVVCAVLEESVGSAQSPLAQLDAVVAGLARKLQESDTVRGAARLEQERPTASDAWSRLWYPVMLHLAAEACRSGDLPPTTRPEQAASLAALFIRGCGIPPHTTDTESAVEQHLDLWAIIQKGIMS
ncbi:TetR family transcriptional regulator [Streptomyces sp. AP-93]|uniref:TetR family transcriptional regulator n=1 Tax=Streptomyces sp. AP-93 TaxID=2929048 RepID=UPI001FB00FB4|nr:TetR family transcriptional regulator [Streptomyces sp. AP-93]MCJ0871923.1 TetR family transcriptional regulator [Streptomyces sp. AP-93]